MMKKPIISEFHGTYNYTIDAKGRVNIPAPFRQRLAKENDQTFVITSSEDQCIWVYPITIYQETIKKLSALSSVSPRNRIIVRKFARFATEVQYDKQGRIVITKPLIEYAGLSKDVIIIGALNKIEIWDPFKLAELDADQKVIDDDTLHEMSKDIIL